MEASQLIAAYLINKKQLKNEVEDESNFVG